MKKFNLLSAILVCFVLLATGQTDNTVLTGKSYRNSVPDYIREKKAFKRAEWFYNQRAFPYDTIPVIKYRQEMTKEIQKAKSNLSKSVDDLNWTSVGPSGVQFSLVPHLGIVSGRVRALAIHPADPLTVYIGAASGGLWKTTDGGENWLDIGHNLESLTFGAIAIDPGNPEIVYAGAGECNLLEGFYLYPGNGLYKSTDGGQNWSIITNGFGSVTFFSDLAVSPYNSNIIVATLGGGSVFTGVNLPNEGIWKSLDGGMTWDKTLDVPEVADIAFHPANPNKLYAAAGGYFSPLMGFYISNDQGTTWLPSNSGLMLPPLGGRMQFDISQSNPNIIYSVIYECTWNPVAGPTRAFKSEDGGINWTPISAGTQLGGNYGSGWTDQGFYDLCIAVDPDDPNHVLIGNIELHRTINGSTFSPVRPYGNNAWGSLAHVDYHKLVFAPSNPNILYIGCDGGIYKSTDNGYTANSQNQGLETLQFYRIASHPSNPQALFGGMQDNGTAMTTDGGLNWHVVTGSDGMECLFNPNPDTLYTSSQYGCLFRSINAGVSFSNIYNGNSAWVTPFLMHPTNHKILYTATKKILKSTNAGNSFQVISGTSNVAPLFISSMAQSQVNPNYMIFGTGLDHPHLDTVFVVKISTDEGVTWNDVSQNIPGEERWISRVQTDPVDANTMYILRTGFSAGNKVWKTTDLGQTWTNISGDLPDDLPDLPCSDLFIDPENTQHLYLANDIGVYHSGNGGISWEFASAGVPNVPAIDFDYVKIGTDRYLRVGTHGRSIYQTLLPNYCLPEGITFTTQEQIDNFQTNYPGCTEIEGSVTVNGEDITNLNGLSVISSIGTDLIIGDYTWPFYVSNPHLTSLTGLDNLTSVGGNLNISNDTALISLAGLEGLTFIGGSLLIEENYNLINISGIGNLASLGGLSISGNPLVNLIGLESVTSIGGDCDIGQSAFLNSLSGLENLISIGGSFIIHSNDGLNSLTGLNNLTYIGGNFNISQNNSLTSLSGLDSLTSIGGILGIVTNNALTSLAGLESLTSIGGSNIYNNYTLTSLTGLESLTTAGGAVIIGTNPSLVNLSGLESLTSIGGNLGIGINDALTSLSGLENLTSIGGYLIIYKNNALTNLSGLDNINAGSISELSIWENDLLSTCDVQSICDYLATPNGTIEIHDNAPGCNSPEEVEQHCLTTVEEIKTGNGITIIPNPSNDKITISSPAITGNTQLSIFNVSGEKILERQLTDTKTQLDISALPRGVYFVRVQNEKMVEVAKMIKE